jgi:hypothetical protein
VEAAAAEREGRGECLRRDEDGRRRDGRAAVREEEEVVTEAVKGRRKTKGVSEEKRRDEVRSPILS